MQASFSDLEYDAKKRLTRRDRFLAEIEAVTPWTLLVAELEPFYPKGEGRGRPPIGLEKMLRMYIAQQCFGFSDEAIEDALYDSQAIRRFVGMDLGRESAPDATTLLKFRRLLEKHKLTASIFETINKHLASKGLMMRGGTVVDATIIAAPSSTKNRDRARDPEMHQTKKGNAWHFGMKAHIGVDADSGLVHTVTTTAANEADVEQVADLLHGKEEQVWADSGYRGAPSRVDREDLTWHIAARPSDIAKLREGRAKTKVKKAEHRKASVRAKVEHPFRVIKRQFGLVKVRYRGLAKNTAHVVTLFALSNLWMARKHLMASMGAVRPKTA